MMTGIKCFAVDELKTLSESATHKSLQNLEPNDNKCFWKKLHSNYDFDKESPQQLPFICIIEG